VAKAAGRGKRAPKATGRVVNLSASGACLEFEESGLKIKKNQEVTLTIGSSPQKKPKKFQVTESSLETKIKGQVAWIEDKDKIGIKFAKLSDIQRKEILSFLRLASEN
jgi:hypothetical protein